MTETRGIKPYLIQFIFVFYLRVCVCMCVFEGHICAGGCLRPEEVIRSHGASITGSCEHLIQMPGSKLRSSGEQ